MIIRNSKGQFDKGSKPINGFKKGVATRLGIKLSEETKRKISIANSGRIVSEETRHKLSISGKGKNKGKKHSDETKEKMRKARRDIFKGENHTLWKGDKAGYRAKHTWIERKLGKPDKCEECGTDGLKGHAIQWANISGKYKRIISDWKRLCSKCHGHFDKEKRQSKKN